MTIHDSSTHDGPIAVIGASGQQGRAVVSALLARDVHVRALVRDPSSPRAQHLAQVGAELVSADLNDATALEEALRGATAAFAMTTFAGRGGTRSEIEHGRAIGSAAERADVNRLVYSSVGGAERETGILHFESKRRVEEHLEALDLETTFIRPTFFMDNFASFSQPSMDGDTLVVRLPIPGGVPLQMVSTRDIGLVAAKALLEPASIPDGEIEIAGDEMTGEDAAAAFADALGIPARYEPVSVDALPDGDQKKMFTWFAQPSAYRADMKLTRTLVPELHDLRSWIKEQSR
ncbi:NmrA/HSCARG family protein [Brevibacterium aurantiacum]|uniref:NmrA/HSCARG family protein n=1 Tax=Brevibacterium aurantiacum TaxID=273384 RepID=UPI0018685F28|nr:NmrA/HSCARG family protein [Brevibacterium aurantiacum]